MEPPIDIPGGRRILPFTEHFRVTLPGWDGGVRWQRPVSVAEYRDDGTVTTIPVVDVTRQAQWTIYLMGMVGALLVWLVFGRKSR